MFSKILLIASFALFAVANPTPGKPEVPSQTTNISQCNTGPIQCCNTIESADSSNVTSLLGTLGINLQDPTIPIGVTCIPVSVFGAGGNSCSANPVCCEDNNFNGVVALGCIPINVSV
ncbi:hydrophobin [Pyrrhoderma noxium]|uniref:Hydrophobin n=1 Tax=Pyrrhoderma noxium TaxID=2282107 RepID=A0A286UFM9_9AGAM|nr:hydrophobin [Pyrrhoderma noxium]